LCALLRAAPLGDAGRLTVLGAQDAPQMLLLLPGMQVGALGMFELARQLQERLPATQAVAIVDTDALLQAAPSHRRADHMAHALQQLVRDLGAGRIVGLVGYSVGGVLALQLAQAMGPAWAARVPLWLLDTYAPKHTRQRLAARARRALSSLAQHPWGTTRRIAARLQAGADAARRNGAAAGAAGAVSTKPQWHDLLDELAALPLDTAPVRATLLHARATASRAGVWRHAASNGFDPAHFARLQVCALDCEHYDLRARLAHQVSALIAGQVGAA
jgi:thioesterase domain-containing protein